MLGEQFGEVWWSILAAINDLVEVKSDVFPAAVTSAVAGFDS